MFLETLLDKFKWIFNLNIGVIDLFQMLILTGIIFYLSKTLYRTRAWVLIKGLLMIGIAYLIVYATHMTVIQSIMEGLFSVLTFSIVIMFQPELQKIVEKVGKQSISATINSIIRKPQTEDTWTSDKTIYEIVSACEDMSAVKTGALIVLERGIPLKEYADSGIYMKADVSSQLLLNIFEKNTPLHDGAIIIKDNKVESATCYLPLTSSNNIDKHLGTRHRAAIGITEVTDAIAIAVSEETGSMSICADGKIEHNISRSELSEKLHEFCKKNDEISVKERVHNTPLHFKVASPILAILASLFILNVTDPVVTRNFNDVPVVIQNDTVLTEKGKSYTIESGDEISVVLKGRRSTIDNLKVSDIVATADMEELSIVNAIPINVTTSEELKREVEVISHSKVLKLALENLSQVEVPIEVLVKGTNNEKLMLAEIDGNKTITVTAAESVCKTLDKAIVVVNIAGEKESFTTEKEAIIYDKNGTAVPVAKLKFNNIIPIKCTAYPTKTVPVKIQIGKLPDNSDYSYKLENFEAEVETIQIAGEQWVLNSVNSIDLVIIPEEGLETVTKMVFKLENYLPANTYLGPAQNEELPVVVTITKHEK